MKPVMRELDGLGLAATQVGISKRLFIVEIPKSGKVIVAVNPEIITISENKDVMEEGCLSIPGHYIPIARSVKIKNIVGAGLVSARNIIHLSTIGKIIDKHWQDTSDQYYNVELDEYIIIVNHIYCFLIINNY